MGKLFQTAQHIFIAIFLFKYDGTFQIGHQIALARHAKLRIEIAVHPRDHIHLNRFRHTNSP